MNKIISTAVLAAAVLGCIALAVTTFLIVISVIGRHTQIPLPGSVEMVEVLIVIIGSTSLLVATFDNTHASAKLFINRLSEQRKIVVEKIGFFLGACFSLALLIGTIWIALDYWSTREATHLLGIPIMPFRLLFALSLLLVSWILMRRLLKKSPT